MASTKLACAAPVRNNVYMSVTHPDSQEVVARGQAIYESRIRQLVEPAHIGDSIVIDVETGEYEIDADHLAASDRAAVKHPDGSLFAMRVGQRALGRIGGNSRATVR
jgi:hypothetical protein